jgi:type I restriction enzyme R subunit
MSRQTNERAFELHVEEVLLQQGNWQSRGRTRNGMWSARSSLSACARFLEATQPKLWAEMRALHAAGLEKLLIGALVKELDLKGALHVLRHGFKFYGKTFRSPTSSRRTGLNDEVLAFTARTSSRSRARCSATRASTTRWTCCSR